jgi:putative addiction module component (TIGR02574 family)
MVTPAAEKILAEALALPADEREAVVEALSHSLDPVELSPEWRAEIARRIETIERGEAVLNDAEAHLRAMLRAELLRSS